MSLEIFTHRGLGLGPEQTMPAFQAAYAMGGVQIEADVKKVTGYRDDGKPELVLFHDRTVDRTTNGKGSLESFPPGRLQHLDAGYWYGPEYAGTKIPTLDELLGQFGRAGVNLDLKHDIGPDVLTKVKKYGLLATTKFTSFNPNIVTKIKKLEPKAVVGHIVEDVVWQNVATIKDSGVNIVSAQANNTTPRLIETIHKAGLKIFTWFDIADGMNRYNIPDYNVDGIIDGHPPTLIVDLMELKKSPHHHARSKLLAA